MNWKTINKQPTNIFSEVEKYKDRTNIIFHIGTDAQANGADLADFVTVICIHEVGSGGRVLYRKDKKVPTFSLWEKLYGETERSLRIAVALTDKFDWVQDKIMVHVDANPDTRYASSSYVKTLAGMVMGYGFNHVLKPDAFAASHAADHIVKNKN